MKAFDYVYSSNIQGLREYLELGDVNCINERGMSLIHYAILFNNSEIFDLLLENYINVNIMDKEGNTPVHYCVIHNRMGFLKTLIRHGANLKVQNLNLETPLYVASKLGRENIIYLLLESIPYNINEKNINDESMFMALIRSRNLNLLNKVIVSNDMVNEANYLGETPLHIACKAGDLNIIKYLISNHAFVNSKNKLKETPLIYAIKAQNYDVLPLLLSSGAIFDCKSTYGDMAIDYILDNGKKAYVEELLIKYKTTEYKSLYPLHYAIYIEDYALVEKYATIRNINRKDNYGFLPLDLAKALDNMRILNLITTRLR